MREEFEKQIVSFLLKKFDIKNDIASIDASIQNKGLVRLMNIKKTLVKLKKFYLRQILSLLSLKAWFILYTKFN
jgi:hypothetical protein